MSTFSARISELSPERSASLATVEIREKNNQIEALQHS